MSIFLVAIILVMLVILIVHITIEANRVEEEVDSAIKVLREFHGDK